MMSYECLDSNKQNDPPEESYSYLLFMSESDTTVFMHPSL
jgi:hypothetical protein